MSQPNDPTRLMHMLQHAREAMQLTAGKCQGDLDTNRVLSLALVRLMEIIGESAGRVSEQFQSSHRDIPWPQIISLRNRLIHGYGSVDMDILWQILTNDLPVLTKAIKGILEQ